jgi:hypothetical protein
MIPILINCPQPEKAAANFFTPVSQKKPEPIKWRVLGTSLIVGKFTPEKQTQNLPEKDRKVAAFDLVSDFQWMATSSLGGASLTRRCL